MCSTKYVDIPYISDLEVWKHSIMATDQTEREKIYGDGQGSYKGETILHMAIVNGDKDFVEYLLKKGADVNARAEGEYFMPAAKRRGKPGGKPDSSLGQIKGAILSKIHHIDDRVGQLNVESPFDNPGGGPSLD